MTAIRLLSLSSLATEHEVVSYALIASTLQVRAGSRGCCAVPLRAND